MRIADQPKPPIAEIDRFIPMPDVRKRQETLVRAPAGLVFDVAQNFDLSSMHVVRGLFWLRARLLGGRGRPSRWRKGLVAGALDMGWGVLARHPGRLLVLGAATQPWLADVTFTPIPPDRFAGFAEPDRVEIAWTIEAEPIRPGLTRLVTETRVRATDDGARRKFRRYWRAFGAGIVLLRWLALPAMRREAERRYRKVSAFRAA